MFMHLLWKRELLRLLVVILATLAGFAAIILLISFGYQADWTGFNKHIEPTLVGQQELLAKTLWDWMQLLIVPVMLAGGALWFNHTMSQKDQKLTTQRYENDQKIATQRYENDQRITAQHYENDQKIAAQRYENDQKIAAQRYENDQKIALDK